MYRYQVADISIGVEWENEAERNRRYSCHDCVILPRMMEAFRQREWQGAPDMRVLVRTPRRYTAPGACKRIYNQSFCKHNGKILMTVYDLNASTRPGYTIAMSEDYSTVEYTPHLREYDHHDLQWMMFPFEGRAAYSGGIVLHGAAVEYDRMGIVFTGLSGAGKSTQAHLWQKHRDALIINGDCPFIKMRNGTPTVHGTPWCGSSGESINRSAALRAVVLVKQGERNILKQLHGNEAFLALLANVFHSNFDEHTLDLAIESLTGIIEHIRVYELTCTVDEDAVRILEKALIQK